LETKTQDATVFFPYYGTRENEKYLIMEKLDTKS